MSFSVFLESRRAAAKALVAELKKNFAYTSVLGADIRARSVRADKNTSAISPGRDTECGFVIKLSNGGAFFEYSLDDIAGDASVLAAGITDAFRLNEELLADAVTGALPADEPLVRSFVRENDIGEFSEQALLDFCTQQKDALLAKSENVRNAVVILGSIEVSKLFVSVNRELDQNYAWINGTMWVVYQSGERVVQSFDGASSHRIADVLAQLPALQDKLLKKAQMLAAAKPVTPGVYDVITDPSISGLIAHEAFGHGVELDQFVKDRALAKQYMGKYVASPIVNMRDGAASTLSAASYFFDDDGVPAGDTQIIKDGILVAGISDLASAAQLGLAPTGNGRRESTRRKAYSRMTNTFFEKGTDKLEDMIASIKHGYMLFETNNGMEDPKNWAIQCVAEYGIEIVDGKLTENVVSPVVMSGYVPDLLNSITMISDEVKITGAGSCGKGYKEWVRVSDGGPALKVKVKLG
ncbi:MAG: TldD/PmbA family protein [Oscillospiraceae bacterium]|nr:TldD/PmbA family protein [Oscillospiraceae bacterium]